MVGKRGEKVLRLVKLYPEEVVLDSGHVQLKDQAEEVGDQVRSRKRGRRVSGSPSSPTSRRARILPSSFGDQ